MDLSKAQAGAEMAPTDPAAAPLGEAHGRGGVQAASLGSRGLLGAMPAGRCVESHWGRAAPVLLLFMTINFFIIFFLFFFSLPSFKLGPSWLLCHKYMEF